MNWVPVGTLHSTLYWQEMPTPLQSNLIRVAYEGSIPGYPSGVRGYLRLRFGPDTYSSRWFRLYPKHYEKEVLLLSGAFIPAVAANPTIQIRRWAGFASSAVADWSITIEQFDDESTVPGGVQLNFGPETGGFQFGGEDTLFT